MRVLLLFVALSAAPLTDANAQTWNAFSPCEGADLLPHQVQEYQLLNLCGSAALEAKYRAFRVPALSVVAGDRRAARAILAEGRRYRDARRHNLVMIDVIEEGDHVVIIARTIAQGGLRPRLRTVLSAATWGGIADQAADLASAPGVQPDNDLWIHPMEVIVETSGFGEPRVLYADLSRPGPALSFAIGLSDLALNTFQQCAHVSAGESSPWRLRDCVNQRSR
jgi:hypothetical protein